MVILITYSLKIDMKSILIFSDNFLFVKLTPKLRVDFLSELAYDLLIMICSPYGRQWKYPKNYHMRSMSMSKRKYTKEFELKVLKEHEEGASFYSLDNFHILIFTKKEPFISKNTNSESIHIKLLATPMLEMKWMIYSQILIGI